MRKGLGFHNRHSAGGFQPISLFTGGVQGAWYDPSDSGPTGTGGVGTLFSDRAGTTPCGTPGQGSVVPVGAMLDERAPAYSVYFDGTGDYLEAPDNAAFAFGSGNFTIEGWIYLTAYAAVDADGLYNAAIYTQQQSFPTNSKSVLFYLQGTASSYTSIIFTGSSDNVTSTTITGSFTFALNTWYHVACVRNGNNVYLYVNGTQVNSTTAFSLTLQDSTVTPKIGAALLYSGFNYFWYLPGHISNLRIVKGTAVYTGNFTPPTAPLSPITGTSLLTCGTTWSGNPAITKNGDARVDGLNPFTASPVGNHAIAANDTTARPELSARVNLLTYTEQFDNAVWAKAPGVTVTPNTDIAPNGTLTADTLNSSAGNQLAADVACAVNTVYTDTICFKKTSGAAYQPALYLLFTGGTLVVYAVRLNTDTGVATAVSAGGFTAPLSFSVADEGGYWRLFISGNSNNNTTASLRVYPNFAAGGSVAAGSQVIWGADLRPANIGTTIPAYQRIADQYTYDAVGFPRYLAFNGTSSAMSTPANVNLSGTDKATVFAGVRKLSNATAAMLAELSADWFANNGAFAFTAPDGAAATYGIALRGSSTVYASLATFTAPITNVVTQQYDIGASTIAAEIIGRVNSINVALSGTVGSGAGTGNFGSYPLNIGVRSATATPSLFLNGNIYSLIVVGSAVSAGNITATETWVNGKTGGVY